MTQTTDNDILFSNYSRYVSIATEAADNAKESALFRNKLVTEKNIDHEQLVEAASNVHNKATIAIVFSAMAIEAFINEYGVSNFSGSYFKTHLDNLSLMSKLILIPKLANQVELDRTGQVYQEVKWLIEFRNYLVHYRSKKKQVQEIDMTDPMLQKDFVMESHSDRAIKAMTLLMQSLSTKESQEICRSNKKTT